jgi:hypothetical protein
MSADPLQIPSTVNGFLGVSVIAPLPQSDALRTSAPRGAGVRRITARGDMIRKAGWGVCSPEDR